MSFKYVYIMPIVYAVLGGILWANYGAQPMGLVLWIGGQILLLISYIWLIRGGSTGLMMRLHLIVTGLGMLLLFWILAPWKPVTSQQGVLIELIAMGVGTFLCAFGLYTLIYMIGRKILVSLRSHKRRTDNNVEG